MSFQKAPSGTRGARMPRLPSWLARWLTRMMIKWHRRTGNRFQGMKVVYLTTIGAKSGEKRQAPVAWFPDGEAWLIVASGAGSARHPAWYHNIAAHPDQVWIDLNGEQIPVSVEQLDGDRRQAAWQGIAADQRRYASYQEKTDRVLPVLRLTRAG
jgi:deazaflavin-dependent oxidoreductase (nitroreductase family)